MAFVQKADSTFKKRLKFLLTPNGYIHTFPGTARFLSDDPDADDEFILVSKHTSFDRDEVEKLFNQYGSYLEFIEEPKPELVS